MQCTQLAPIWLGMSHRESENKRELVRGGIFTSNLISHITGSLWA